MNKNLENSTNINNLKSNLWSFYGWACWIIFALSLYIFVFGHINITIYKYHIFSARTPHRTLLVLSVLLLIQILFDPKFLWLRSFLARLSSVGYLILGLFASLFNGLGLFAHNHQPKFYNFLSGLSSWNFIEQDIIEYSLIFIFIGIFGAGLYCTRQEDKSEALKKYIRTLCWGFFFIPLISPLFLYLTPQMVFMILIVIYGIILSQLFSISHQHNLSYYTRWLIIIGCTLYTIMLCLLLIKCYLPRNYDDFPFFIQSLSSILDGKMMNVTWLLDPNGQGISYFGDHFSPFLLLLLPFFALWPGPEILIIAQVIFVGLASVPLYYLCKHKFPKNPLLVFAIPFVYLITPWILKGFFFDFHQDAFKPIFIFLSFLWIMKKRWGLYSICMLLLLSTKEDAFLISIFFGFYILFFLKEWKVGILSILSGLVWAVAVMGFIMPYFYPSDEVYRHIANRYAHLGDTQNEILQQLFFHPIDTLFIVLDLNTAHTLLYLFVPLALLPLLSLGGLLIMSPFIAQMMLSSWHYTRTIYFYYPFAVYPLIIISLILGLDHLRRRFANHWKILSKRLGYFLIFATVIFHLFYNSHIRSNKTWRDYYYLHEAPLGHQFNLSYYKIRERNHQAHRIMREIIPPTAPLSTQVRYAAHLATRPLIRMFPNTKDVEYVFLDLYGAPFAKDQGFHSNQIIEFLNQPDFGVIFEQDGFILAQKGAERKLNDQIIDQEKYRFEAEILPRKGIGTMVHDADCPNGWARYASPQKDRFGLLLYGPYLDLKAGPYRAIFRIKAKGRYLDDEVLVIRITSNHAKKFHEEKTILLRDFGNTLLYRNFEIFFTLEEDANIECQIIFTARAEVWLDQIKFEESESPDLLEGLTNN